MAEIPAASNITSVTELRADRPPLKIALVAPLIESVPPKLYGGTERVVAYLSDELVRMGHDVTLFASGDSTTSAKLVPCSERALRLDPRVVDPIPHYMVMLNRLYRRIDEFDIIHFHIDSLQYPLFQEFADRTLTTLHGRQDLFDLGPLYEEFPDAPLVSISNAQRKPLGALNWRGTVYHGQPADLCAFDGTPTDDYMAFVGRICPEKRPDRAIEIARRAGVPLKIAAKIDAFDRAYFESEIKPLFDDPMVEYIGEIGDGEKSEFFGNAKALLFPIDWPEPFGLVMIEAMACGTPVIAFPCGSVPEVIDEGVTGFVVESVDEAVDAVARLDTLDRHGIRNRFETRFSVGRMAQDYVAVYQDLLSRQIVPTPSALPGGSAA